MLQHQSHPVLGAEDIFLYPAVEVVVLVLMCIHDTDGHVHVHVHPSHE